MCHSTFDIVKLQYPIVFLCPGYYKPFAFLNGSRLFLQACQQEKKEG